MGEDIGIILFVLISFVIILTAGMFVTAQQDLITQCELHLPRDKHCHIEAVPDAEH